MTSGTIKIESGIQLLARLTKKPDLKKFYPPIFDNGLKHGDLVEIYSQGSTNWLLAELICEALMPAKFNGPEASVLIFNTDGNLLFTFLLNFLRKKLIKCIKSATEDSPNYNVDCILNSVLKNLYLLEIFDATQLYVSIQNLEFFLSKHHNIALIVFHTLTAFYWSEQDFRIIKMDLYLKKLLSNIQKVIKDHRLVVLYTRPEYFSGSKEIVDHLEPNCQHATEDQINHRIQIVYNNNGVNLINVRSYNSQFQKLFSLIDYEINWL